MDKKKAKLYQLLTIFFTEINQIYSVNSLTTACFNVS